MLSKKFIRSVEVAANVAVVMAAISLAAALIKTYVLPNTARGAGGVSAVSHDGRARGVRTGGKIDLPGVDWAKNGRTLLLVLSSGCRYCTESAPFYQRLVKESGISRIALLPQPVDEGRRYVESLGVAVGEVRQVRLDSLGLAGTPTILIVNDAGVVTDSWLGALSPEQETAVLGRVRTNHAGG